MWALSTACTADVETRVRKKRRVQVEHPGASWRYLFFSLVGGPQGNTTKASQVLPTTPNTTRIPRRPSA
eukprot:694588-Pyramimonas_sp.AAC.1